MFQWTLDATLTLHRIRQTAGCKASCLLKSPHTTLHAIIQHRLNNCKDPSTVNFFFSIQSLLAQLLRWGQRLPQRRCNSVVYDFLQVQLSCLILGVCYRSSTSLVACSVVCSLRFFFLFFFLFFFSVFFSFRFTEKLIV